jgi:hypothetical protein
LTFNFGNILQPELIPPAPFSWEEKGEKQDRSSESPLLFLREGDLGDEF